MLNHAEDRARETCEAIHGREVKHGATCACEAVLCALRKQAALAYTDGAIAGARAALDTARSLALRELKKTDNRITQSFGRGWCESIAAEIAAVNPTTIAYAAVNDRKAQRVEGRC